MADTQKVSTQPFSGLFSIIATILMIVFFIVITIFLAPFTGLKRKSSKPNTG